MVTIFSVPNQTAQSVSTSIPAPWDTEIDQSLYDRWDLFDPKGHTEFKKWCVASSTQHQFFTLNEGDAASLRISAANDVAKIHGVVLDYDCHKQSMDWALAFVNQCEDRVRPTLIGLTARKGIRAVWLFEEPVMVAGKELYAVFSQMFVKELALDKMLPSLDTNYKKPSMVFERCREWKATGYLFPTKVAQGIMIQASEKLKWSESPVGDPSIEDIAKLVEEYYPNRWEGAFALGANSLRFWDPSADNPKAAIVRPAGMQCFTGPKPFVFWRDIFPAAVVNSLVAENLASVVNAFAYDGTVFYHTRESGKKEVVIRTRTELENLLVTYLHVDKKKLQGVTARIEYERRIDSAYPLHFKERGIVTAPDGNRLLNISRLHLMPPAQTEDTTQWGDGFPSLKRFLEVLFDHQLNHFLAYLAHTYQSAFNKESTKGQVTFLVGPPGTGKSFLVNKILGDIFGGVQSGGSYFVGGDIYNAHLFDKFIWVLDDELPLSEKNSKYTNLLKQVAANRQLTYRPMYSAPKTLEWYGRMFVTSNDDMRSLEILPEMDCTNQDKVNFYRCCDTSGVVSIPELVKVLAFELPNFCSFLRGFFIPEEIRDPRFGVKAFHNGEVVRRSNLGGRSSIFVQILEGFCEEYFRGHEDQAYLEMPHTRLYRLLFETNATNLLISRSKFSEPVSFTRALTDYGEKTGFSRNVDRGNDNRIILLNPTMKESLREEALLAIINNTPELIPDSWKR